MTKFYVYLYSSNQKKLKLKLFYWNQFSVEISQIQMYGSFENIKKMSDRHYASSFWFHLQNYKTVKEGSLVLILPIKYNLKKKLY